MIQAFLVAMELLAIVGAYGLLLRFRPPQSAARLLFWGIALNPICVLLTVQHCNFDVIAGLLCLTAVSFLARYVRTLDPVEWLAACLALGLAILTKTVPLVLLPLLLLQSRTLRIGTRALGAALALGPVLLGMSIIYTLSPDAVTRHVLMYRSAIGMFGLTGLPPLIGLEQFPPIYARYFVPALLAVLIAAGWLAYRVRSVSDRQVVLWAASLLVAIPALGPGYAPQYLYWSLPLLVVCYCLLRPSPRRWMQVCALVAIATYVIEYSFLPYLGALVCALSYENQVLRGISDALYAGHWEALLRLPLFVAMLITLWMLLRSSLQPAAQPQPAEVTS